MIELQRRPSAGSFDSLYDATDDEALPPPYSSVPQGSPPPVLTRPAPALGSAQAPTSEASVSEVSAQPPRPSRPPPPLPSSSRRLPPPPPSPSRRPPPVPVLVAPPAEPFDERTMLDAPAGVGPDAPITRPVTMATQPEPEVPSAPWRFFSRRSKATSNKAPSLLAPGDATASEKQDTTARLFTRLTRAAETGQWSGQELRHALGQLERREPQNPYVKLLRLVCRLACTQMSHDPWGATANEEELKRVRDCLETGADGNARFYRGLALLGLGEPLKAAAEFKAACDIAATGENVTHAPAAFYFYWGNALYEAGKCPEAIQVYIRALRASRAPAATNDGNELRAYAKVQFHLARAYVNEQRWEDAVKALKEVVDLNQILGEYHYGYSVDPTTGELRHYHSTMAHRAGQYDKLNKHRLQLRQQIAALALLVEHDPDNHSAAVELAELTWQVGDHDGARRHCTAVAAQARRQGDMEKKGVFDPSMARNLVELGDRVAKLKCAREARDFYLGAFDVASARCERAMREVISAGIDDTFEVVDMLRERGLNDEARRLSSTNSLVAEAVGMERCEAAAGHLAQQHMDWGDKLKRHGLEKPALEQFRLATQLVVTSVQVGLAQDLGIDAQSVMAMATQLAQRGAADSAAELVEVLDEVVGDNILAFVNVARDLSHHGFAEKAVSLWPRALERQPYHLDAWFDYALALVDAGDMKRATEALDRAIGLDPERRGELLATFGQRVTEQRGTQSQRNTQGV